MHVHQQLPIHLNRLPTSQCLSRACMLCCAVLCCTNLHNADLAPVSASCLVRLSWLQVACLVATEILALVGLRSFRTAALLLVGLLAYDVFWVFGSPQGTSSICGCCYCCWCWRCDCSSMLTRTACTSSTHSFLLHNLLVETKFATLVRPQAESVL